jgi:copper homeostasis protein
VLEGLDLIIELVSRAAGRIIVMPGGGITDRNAARIAAASRASELHFASLEPRDGRMAYRNARVFMGGTLRPPEYARDVTRPDAVAAVIQAARGQGKV